MARKQAETEQASGPVPETLESTVAEQVEETIEAVEESVVETTREFSDAIREGASDARAAAANFLPAVGKLVHRGVYGGFYHLTYGIVFGSMVVGSLIPSNNAMGEGVRDGICAARKAFEEKRKAAKEPEASEMEEGLVPA